MDRPLRRGTSVDQRTRSVVRRRRRQHTSVLFVLAVVIAVIACSSTYLIVSEQPGKIQSVLANPIGFLNTPTPWPVDPVVQPPLNTHVGPQDTTAIPTLASPTTPLPPILYYTQSGDTLTVVATRFGVSVEDITSPHPIQSGTLLEPNQLLIIPNRLAQTTPSQQVMPDSEVVFSPSAIDFNTAQFVDDANGRLKAYKEYINSAGRFMSGAEIVQQLALDNSINPRLLLSLLEYQSHWVYGEPANLAVTDYPMGFIDLQHKGLYNQLAWAISQLSVGYYQWRSGQLLELTFTDGATERIAPEQNPGSVSVMYFMSLFHNRRDWAGAVFDPQSLPNLHQKMFGNPWLRAKTVEPLLPANLTQPVMILPFMPDQVWSLTGGPHGAWEAEGALAALDFAPAASESGCATSDRWATAAASGLVVRSGNGVVILDLDGDGQEQTGWTLLYLHIADDGRVPAGAHVDIGDPIGHPSCQGGVATGTHLHFARKYNGEWILADGPLPFTLSGFVAHAGAKPYQGTLTRGSETVRACACGDWRTNIRRPADDLP